MNSATPLIQAIGLQKEHNSDARLTLSVEPGTITCVIGPETGEISSWLKIMAGLKAYTDGDLELQGRNLQEMDRENWQQSRREIGFLSTNCALLSFQNIMENILTPAYYHKLGTRDELIQKAQVLLEQAGYTDQKSLSLLPAYVDSEKRYLAMLVRMLMLNPKVLFFDNIFSKIGIMAKNSMYKLLKENVVRSGMAIILNTRNLDFAAKYANTILFISSSKILKFESFQELQATREPAVEEYMQKYTMR